MRVLTVSGALFDTIAFIGTDRIERVVMPNADASFLPRPEALEAALRERRMIVPIGRREP